jgi:hypothetical protein
VAAAVGDAFSDLESRGGDHREARRNKFLEMGRLALA